jgi:hypothetical protein
MGCWCASCCWFGRTPPVRLIGDAQCLAGDGFFLLGIGAFGFLTHIVFLFFGA